MCESLGMRGEYSQYNLHSQSTGGSFTNMDN